MISESRAKEIDYYFLHDHRARNITFLLASSIGSAAYLFGRMRGFSEKTSVTIALALVLTTFYIRISGYHRSFKKSAIVKSIWKIFEIDSEFDFGRRWALIRMSSIGAVLALLAVWDKNFSEAEAVNRGIANLRRSGRNSTAAKLANHAAESIPLDPENLISLDSRSADLDSRNAVVDNRASFTPQAQGSAWIRLQSGTTIIISTPILYIPVGQYRLGGTLIMGGASTEGDGAQKSHLLADFSESPETPAIFKYASMLPNDTLIFGLSGRLRHDVPSVNPPAFIVIEDEIRKVAVSNVAISGLKQVLDRGIWEDSIFTGCNVACAGGRLQVTNVQFVDCAFTFADNIPAFIREMLEHNRGEGLSFSFNP